MVRIKKCHAISVHVTRNSVLNTKKKVVEKKKCSTNKKPNKRGEDAFRLQTLSPLKWLPRGHFSSSQIDMYQRCAMQYYFRYIESLKTPPAVALTEGICHHDALDMNNKHKIKKKKDLKTRLVVEKFNDEFDTKCKDIPRAIWKTSGERKDLVIKRGNNLIENYMRSIAPYFNPITSEERFEVDVAGIPFLGFIDLTEEKVVTDYKVVRSAKSQKDADTDSQLTLYSYHKGISNVRFCCLTKTVSSSIRLVQSSRDNGDYLAFEEQVKSVVSSIKKGSFPMCSPTNTFPCSEKWCGYWFKCRGKYLRKGRK